MILSLFNCKLSVFLSLSRSQTNNLMDFGGFDAQVHPQS